MKSIVAIIFVLSVSSRAQTTPAVNGATIAASVSNAGGFYSYMYSVQNSGASTAGIAQIQIDISQPPGSVSLDDTGLPVGQGFASDIAAMNATDTNSAPFVFSTADAPTGWIAGINMNASLVWGAGTLNAVIVPGQVQGGFVLYSRGLPAIRSFSAEPDLDVDSLPIPAPTPETLADYVAAVAQIRAQVRTTGVTIGPTAPPANFDPVKFLQTIQEYKDASFQQGWISNAGVANSLDSKLNAALTALQAQDLNTAANILNAFLNEVSAQSGKFVTPEAVGLLEFNVQYLLSKIS